jgi:LysW-gamma-L-lysine carboxypeptidase
VNAVEMLHEMVAIPSVSGNESDLADYLVRAMDALGFDARVDGAGNAVGERRGPAHDGPTREVVLLGHMDTVPGEIPVRQEDGLLHGRGSVDAKGPLATFVQAVARVDPAPGVTLTVIGAVEEEVSSSRGARHVAAEHDAPEVCLIGEPSGWDGLTLGYKGCTTLRYRRAQDGGHGAGPTTAVAEHAVAFWNTVVAMADDHNAGHERVFHQLSPSLRAMATSTDGLHDVAELELGFRLPLGFDLDAFVETARSHAEGATLELDIAEPAWATPRGTPLVGAFGRSLARHGERVRCKHKTGTSDMNVLGPRWRCPIVAYGPGDSSLDHTPHEHIVLAEYEQAIDVLAHVLVDGGYATA